MKAKDIENILSNSGRLILKDYPFGASYFVENDDGFEFSLSKKQFEKFKETCENKDESKVAWFNGETTTWYYWRK